MPQNEPIKNENQTEKAQEWVNVKFPPGFAHPYEFTDKTGKTWEKAIINIPPNTKMNGVDLTGYSVDVFLNNRQMSQIANGDSLTCGFKAGEKIELFQGKGEDQKTLQVDPWNLTKAIKTQRDEYAATKAAEREASKEAPATSLSDRANDAKEVSKGLDDGMGAPVRNVDPR